MHQTPTPFPGTFEWLGDTEASSRPDLVRKNLVLPTGARIKKMVKRVLVLGHMAAAGWPATPRPCSLKAVVKPPVCPHPSQVFYRPKFPSIPAVYYDFQNFGRVFAKCASVVAFDDALREALKQECGVDDFGTRSWNKR